MHIKLTPTQIEHIEHRLDVPDAIADCLYDNGELNGHVFKNRDEAQDRVDKACNFLWKAIHGTINTKSLSPAAMWVFNDCVADDCANDLADDAASRGEITEQKARAIRNSIDGLRAKLAEAHPDYRWNI